MNMTSEQASRSYKEIINKVLIYGGVVTILWHERSLAPERLWGDFYSALLEQLKRHRAWFATASQITKWFEHRRSISFTDELFSDKGLNLTLESPKALPYSEFSLRFYEPIANGDILMEKSAGYVEIPWSGQKNITILFR
jgi:hypothetical protein